MGEQVELEACQKEISRLRSIVRTQERDTIDMLRIFEANADKKEFGEIFGEIVGSHLWDKFVKLRRNFLWFYGVLDEQNRDILTDYLHFHR